MENNLSNLKELKENIIVFLKWNLIALIIGSFIGVVGVLFHLSVEWATEMRLEHPNILYLLPIGGIIIAWLYKISGMENDKGTNFVLTAVRDNYEISIKTAPLIFISSLITHLFGGSSGREGAALQLGGSIASKFGRIIHLDEKDERLITMCGMSAAFSALFGTPVTSVIFSMEVITIGVMHYSAIVPCSIAAIVGLYISTLFGIEPTKFTIIGTIEFNLVSICKVLIIGVLCAGVSILFCYIMKKVGYLYKKYISNTIIRAAIGGVIVVIFTTLIGNRDYNGIGMNIIIDAINGNAFVFAFLLKIIFTAFTLSAGFKGGEIVPSFFIGATFGCVIGKVLAFNPSFSAALGLVGIFCGVTNCPISSIILSVELFGANGIIYFAFVCAISYMLSGYYSLYSEQKILYSKIKPIFINKKAN